MPQPLNMPQPSKLRSIMGGVVTAAKWLVGAAIVAGLIACFVPVATPLIGGIAAELGATAASGASWGAFIGGAKALFTAFPIFTAVLGGLHFVKGAVITHRNQQQQIFQAQQIAGLQQGGSPGLQPGQAKGLSFENDPNHPALAQRGSVLDQVRQRGQQQVARQPGNG